MPEPTPWEEARRRIQAAYDPGLLRDVLRRRQLRGRLDDPAALSDQLAAEDWTDPPLPTADRLSIDPARRQNAHRALARSRRPQTGPVTIYGTTSVIAPG